MPFRAAGHLKNYDTVKNFMSKKYYPVNIDVSGKRCLVVGGGPIGERKALSLLSCGARVTVVSKTLTPALESLAREGRIEALRRPFDHGDVEGAFLVFCATNDCALNRSVFELADKKSLLVNVVDEPVLCNFIVPAVVRKGPLLASVSTSAAAPAMAKKLKRVLELAFEDGYAPLLEFLSEKRKQIKASVEDIAARKKIFDALIGSELSDLFLKFNAADISSADFDFDEYKKNNPGVIEKAEKIFEEVFSRTAGTARGAADIK